MAKKSFLKTVVVIGISSIFFSVPVFAESGKVYFSDDYSHKVKRVNLDGSGSVEDIVADACDVFGIAIDSIRGKIYWANHLLSGNISRANLDGTEREVILTGLNSPVEIEIDTDGSKIYWTEENGGKIGRANLDGSDPCDLVTGLSAPEGLALDVAGGKIYWGDSTNTISKADLNGNNIQDIVTEDIHAPSSLDISNINNRIYWSDGLLNKIKSVNLDGSDPCEVIAGLTFPLGIAIDSSGWKIYYANLGSHELKRANLDGTNQETLVPSINPHAVALYLPPTEDDDYEDNETFETATKIPVNINTSVYGLVASSLLMDSVDIYRIPVCTSSTLTVNCRFIHDMGNIDIELDDASYDRVKYSMSENDNESVTHSFDYDGYAYLLVMNCTLGTRNWYTLDINLENATCNHLPEVSNVDLHSSSGQNLHNDDLTVSYDLFDADLDDVKPVINWLKDGNSITLLNIPFERVNDTDADNGKDYSGYGNDATDVGGVTWVDNGGYDGGAANQYNGLTGYSWIPTSRSFNTTAPFTWTLWFKVLGDGGSHLTPNQQHIFGKARTTNSCQWGMYYEESEQRVAAWFYDADNNTQWLYSDSGSIPMNELTHVAFGWDGEKILLYVNGQLVGTTAATAPANFGDYDLYIGSAYLYAGDYRRWYNGIIDELMYFDRALSEEQIVAISQGNTAFLAAEETHVGETWKTCITPNDGREDGDPCCSNELTIMDQLPTVDSIELVSEYGLNSDIEDLTVNYTISDADGDPCKAIIDWKVDGNSMAVLNMPFEAHSGDESLLALDYSSEPNNADVLGAAWEPDGGHDGWSSYYLDGTGSHRIEVPDFKMSQEMRSNFSVEMWARKLEPSYQWTNTFGVCMWYSGGPSAGSNMWELNFTNAGSDDKPKFAIERGSTTYAAVGDPMTIGDWYHLVGTYDSETVTLYVNGDEQIVTNTDPSGPMNQNLNRTLMIGDSDIHNESTEMDISLLRVCDRALSAEQVYQLYLGNDIIVSEETQPGDKWQACITPNDGIEDGDPCCSNELEIARTIYVDDTATGSGRGLNWCDAYTTLQEALNDANAGSKPVAVLVAGGTYQPDRDRTYPNGSGDPNASFRLFNELSLGGGFAGCGTRDPNERDIETYESILSGDLDGNDVYVEDPCDLLNDLSRADNCRSVVTVSYVGNETILDGFSITAGNAKLPGPPTYNHNPETRGGGIYCSHTSLKISNCVFNNNSSQEQGGGIYGFDLSEPYLTNCIFNRNAAGVGGGIFFEESDGIVTNCVFSGNHAVKGGGLFHYYYNGFLTLSNCTFSGNTADYGDGICVGVSEVVLNNCILWGSGDEIYKEEQGGVTVSYSNIQGGIKPGIGNISQNPLFVNPAGGDYRLGAGSPCIDAGSISVLPQDVTDMDNDGDTTELIPYALDGRKRVMIGTCSFPAFLNPDMGAYEFSYRLLGDFDTDCDVDFTDYAILADTWLAEEGELNYNQICDIALPADKTITFEELKILCDNWLVGTD
ncbi:MAG: hypothetical protein JXA01_09850 [Dehalococcoidia bacterium]|nr:hypothetical protein [Dehalococcoidia bacterium]